MITSKNPIPLALVKLLEKEIPTLDPESPQFDMDQHMRVSLVLIDFMEKTVVEQFQAMALMWPDKKL